MKSFWHFNFYFKKTLWTGITTSYLHVCLSEEVSLRRPPPLSVSLPEGRSPLETMNNSWTPSCIRSVASFLQTHSVYVFYKNLDSTLCLKTNTQLPLFLLLPKPANSQPPPSPLLEKPLLLICWRYSLDPVLRSLPGCPIAVPVLPSLLCFSVLYSIYKMWVYF